MPYDYSDFEERSGENDEYADSFYSDPPGEHEFHDDFDYDDYDIPRGRLYPDPDDDETPF